MIIKTDKSFNNINLIAKIKWKKKKQYKIHNKGSSEIKGKVKILLNKVSRK